MDNWFCAKNNTDNALRVNKTLTKGKTIAIALDLGNATMFHISFVPLDKAIPDGMLYEDGSARGIQINIDRISSYALPRGSAINECTYLMEKWNVGQSDAEALLPFFNTVLTGKNYFI
jgi:hypothetical protein